MKDKISMSPNLELESNHLNTCLEVLLLSNPKFEVRYEVECWEKSDGF